MVDMPRFVCDSCGHVAHSKEAFNTHDCNPDTGDSENSSGFGIPIGDVDLTDPMTLGVIFIAFAFAGSTFAFAMFSSGNTSNAEPREEGEYSLEDDTTPPTGAGLTQVDQLPSIDSSDMPEQHVVTEPIPDAVQVHLLVGTQNQEPAVLLQYTDISQEEQQELRAIARDWQPRVYVAPYSDMGNRLAYTTFRGRRFADAVNRTEIESFICQNLRSPPAQCVF